MEQRLSIVTLGVSDLKRSREFYERLGWRRSMPKAEGSYETIWSRLRSSSVHLAWSWIIAFSVLMVKVSPPPWGATVTILPSACR